MVKKKVFVIFMVSLISFITFSFVEIPCEACHDFDYSKKVQAFNYGGKEEISEEEGFLLSGGMSEQMIKYLKYGGIALVGGIILITYVSYKRI